MTGGTQQMAAAAAAGARREPAVRVSLLGAAEAQAADVLQADGFLFATPENLAAMSGKMKDFFDRTYYAALDGSDGRTAAQQIERIATGWRLKPIADPIIVCTHAQTPAQILQAKHISEADLARCRELGQALASGIALGIF
jgi:hypothetical protein